MSNLLFSNIGLERSLAAGARAGGAHTSFSFAWKLYAENQDGGFILPSHTNTAVAGEWRHLVEVGGINASVLDGDLAALLNLHPGFSGSMIGFDLHYNVHAHNVSACSMRGMYRGSTMWESGMIELEQVRAVGFPYEGLVSASAAGAFVARYPSDNLQDRLFNAREAIAADGPFRVGGRIEVWYQAETPGPSTLRIDCTSTLMGAL